MTAPKYRLERPPEIELARDFVALVARYDLRIDVLHRQEGPLHENEPLAYEYLIGLMQAKSSLVNRHRHHSPRSKITPPQPNSSHRAVYGYPWG
jgi:hypothetical protein